MHYTIRATNMDGIKQTSYFISDAFNMRSINLTVLPLPGYHITGNIIITFDVSGFIAYNVIYSFGVRAYS